MSEFIQDYVEMEGIDLVDANSKVNLHLYLLKKKYKPCELTVLSMSNRDDPLRGVVVKVEYQLELLGDDNESV